MWETIKNDPIIRTVTIIILGVLGFGFAFNIMFGPRNGYGMGMDNREAMMGGGGYSLGNTLSYIFIITFKLLLIALAIVALVYLFKLASKHLSPGGEIKLLDSIKKDPILKSITVIVLLIIMFGLISILFKDLLGTNNSYGMSGAYGSGMTGYNAANAGISGVLISVFQVLLFVSVIGVVIGLVMYFKQNYSKQIVNGLSFFRPEGTAQSICPQCNFSVPNNGKFCPECGTKLLTECSECGEELKAEWKCCPSCGSDIVQTSRIIEIIDESDHS